MSYSAAVSRAAELRERLGIESTNVRRIDNRGFDTVLQTAKSGFVQGPDRITTMSADAIQGQYGAGTGIDDFGPPPGGGGATDVTGTGGAGLGFNDGTGGPAALRALIDRAASKHGVPRELVAAVVRAESGGRPDAVSPAGAIGLMQLMPATAAGLGVRDARDPAQNVDGGTKYLRQMLDRYDGNVRLALAGYNAGPGNVDRYGGIPPFTETKNYVARVLKYAAEAGFRP